MMPESSSTVVTLIDMQERLCSAIAESAEILPRNKVLAEAAKALEIPLLVTEQYPRGLGPTLAGLKEILPPETKYLEKTAFSCFGAEAYRRETAKTSAKTMVIAGVEAHVCVLQTALDAVERGYAVYVPGDCVASRRASDKDAALACMRSAGIHVVTSEMLIFFLLRDASHPAFKTISGIIR